MLFGPIWHTTGRIPPEYRLIESACSCAIFAVFTQEFSKVDLIFNPLMTRVEQRYLKSFPASLCHGQHLTARISPGILVFEQFLNLGTFLINFPFFFFFLFYPHVREICLF